MDHTYTTHTLDNGLRILLAPMSHTRSVTVLVLVGTGSKYETKEINGISHFLEHMMFKGTKKRPGKAQIALELDSIGAEYNAFTSKEYTGYYAKSSTGNLDIIMDVITDIFLNSQFDENEIKKEKNVIVEEINMYLDDPPRYVGDLFEKSLYGDQPAGWNVAGEKETVVNFTREQFVDYFNTHYVAQNTVVAVAGNIGESETRQKVMRLFENIRVTKPVEKLPVREKQKGPRVLLHHKKTDQSHFILGVRAYNLFDDRNEALKLLSVILGGGMSSRLFLEVREKRGLAYYVGAGAQAYSDSGYFEVSAGVDNKRFEKAVEIIIKELKKVKEEGIPEKDLKKAKQYIKGKTAIALESSDDVASFYASQWLLEKNILTLEEKFRKIEKVTREQVHAVAQDIFKTEKVNLALIGPYKAKAQVESLLLEL